MTDLNKCAVIGRLTRDIEVTYTPNGAACGKISLAVNESRKSGNEWVENTNYFDVTIWGKSAENLKPYLTKGKQTAIGGHLQQQRWEKNGQHYSKVVIIADNVQLIGGHSDNNNSGNNAKTTVTTKATAENAGYYEQNNGGFPEDLPF